MSHLFLICCYRRAIEMDEILHWFHSPMATRFIIGCHGKALVVNEGQVLAVCFPLEDHFEFNRIIPLQYSLIIMTNSNSHTIYCAVILL